MSHHPHHHNLLERVKSGANLLHVPLPTASRSKVAPDIERHDSLSTMEHAAEAARMEMERQQYELEHADEQAADEVGAEDKMRAYESADGKRRWGLVRRSSAGEAQADNYFHTSVEKAMFKVKMQDWKAKQLNRFDTKEDFRAKKEGKHGDRAGFESFMDAEIVNDMEQVKVRDVAPQQAAIPQQAACSGGG